MLFCQRTPHSRAGEMAHPDLHQKLCLAFPDAGCLFHVLRVCYRAFVHRARFARRPSLNEFAY